MTARVASAYQDSAADDYFSFQEPLGELGATLNLAKFAGHVRPEDAVLDFGCGAGGLLCQLPGRTKIGVEASEPARRRALRRGLEVVSSVDEVPDRTIDVVISNHALEHTLSPLTELQGLHRVLRAGGKLVLWLPIDDWRSNADPATDPNHHLYTWTPLLLHNLLVEAGFEVVESRVVAHAWPPRPAALMKLPKFAFDLTARVWSVLRRRRQLMAVARRLT